MDWVSACMPYALAFSCSPFISKVQGQEAERRLWQPWESIHAGLTTRPFREVRTILDGALGSCFEVSPTVVSGPARERVLK